MWANELSNWKPALQKELYHLALYYNTRKRTSEYAGGKEKIAQKVDFRHLSSFSYKSFDKRGAVRGHVPPPPVLGGIIFYLVITIPNRISRCVWAGFQQLRKHIVEEGNPISIRGQSI